jgi:hypothetical protein
LEGLVDGGNNRKVIAYLFIVKYPFVFGVDPVFSEELRGQKVV